MANSNRNNYTKPQSSTEASRRSRPFYKTPIFLVICILVVCGAVFTGIMISKKSKQNPNNDTSTQQTQDSTPSPEPNASGKTEKVSGSTPDSNDESDGKTPVQYDGENPNNSDSLTGNITYAGFSGNKFMIRVSIDQYLSSGTCSLSISDGNNSYEDVASIFPEASTSSCEGFDVPTSELEEFSDNIEILIELSSGDKTGTITGVATL